MGFSNRTRIFECRIDLVSNLLNFEDIWDRDFCKASREASVISNWSQSVILRRVFVQSGLELILWFFCFFFQGILSPKFHNFSHTHTHTHTVHTTSSFHPTLELRNCIFKLEFFLENPDRTRSDRGLRESNWAFSAEQLHEVMHNSVMIRRKWELPKYRSFKNKTHRSALLSSSFVSDCVEGLVWTRTHFWQWKRNVKKYIQDERNVNI
jgi:hypothetical protein